MLGLRNITLSFLHDLVLCFSFENVFILLLFIFQGEVASLVCLCGLVNERGDTLLTAT